MSLEKTAANRDWREKRIDAINRQVTKCRGERSVAEYYAEEHLQVIQSKCKNKKEYKKWIRENGKA